MDWGGHASLDSEICNVNVDCRVIRSADFDRQSRRPISSVPRHDVGARRSSPPISCHISVRLLKIPANNARRRESCTLQLPGVPTDMVDWHKWLRDWATFQSDGNFVVYSASSVPLWHTSTYGLGATALALQDDGNLVISSPVGPIWQTNTSGYTVTDNMYPTSTMNNPPCTGSYGWSGGENCQTQNSLVTTSVITYVGGLSTTTRDLIHSWNEYHYGPTDLAFIPRLAADEWEGVGDYTDIIFEHNSAIFPYSGYTWCAFAVSATSCDTHFVAFSSTAPSANVICHETGHALGLLHGVESAPAFWNDDSRLGCLVAPVPAGSSLALGGQNAGIINATY